MLNAIFKRNFYLKKNNTLNFKEKHSKQQQQNNTNPKSYFIPFKIIIHLK